MKQRLYRLFALTLLLLSILLAGCSPEDMITQAVKNRTQVPEDYVSIEDGFRYAKGQLTPQEKYLYDQLLEGIRQQSPEIKDLYPDNDLIRSASEALRRDYPELFWFSGAGQMNTTLWGSVAVSASYVPKYTVDSAARDEYQKSIDRWTADCLATVPMDGSDYDKALAVYRYIIEHTDYRTTDANSIVNVMVHGYGLCGCYAMTTQYLLQRVGIDCAYVSGHANGAPHAWNLVWLDGNPCWLDTTWGDPVFEGGNPSDEPSYDYFCITTADLLRTHVIDDTIPIPDCVCEDYNYYRHSGQYFQTYDWEGLVAAVERAVSAGEPQVALRFADGVYPSVKSDLFSASQLYTLFQRVDGDLGTSLSSAQRMTYTCNDTMGTLTLVFPG